MKRTFLLKMMLLLCALVAGSSSVWADADETVTFSEQGYENQQEITGYTGTYFSIAFDKGTNSNAPKYYTSGTAIRAYGGNTMTVSSDTKTIIKIEIEFGSSDGTNAITTDVEKYENGTWSNDTGASSVTFTIGGSSGNRRIASVAVTYLVDNRTEVNLTSFTAEKTTLIVGNEQATAVTNDQSGWTAAYTYSSEDESVATISTSGVITAIGKGTTTVWAELNVASTDATYKKGSTYKKSINITVNKPSHTAQFSVNGVIDPANSVEVEEDDAIIFPTVPAAIGGQTFMGWTTAPIDGTQADAPSTLITTATTPMGTDDVTYYAVFATTTSGTTTITDELTYNNIGITGNSYSSWEDIKDKTDAVYSGCTAGGNNAIQMNASTNTSKRGIISTTTGGKLKKVTVIWNTNTQNARTLEIYGSNTAYSTIANFNGTGEGKGKGTKIGDVVKGTSTEITVSDDYAYVGFYATGALYLDKISIDWEATGTIYSDYCTSVPNSVSITPAKTYTTLTSKYPLDFTNTGITPYIVLDDDASDGKITMTQINKVPANTGLILKAATPGSSVDVPVFDGIGADDVSGNKMVGSATATTHIDANGGYILSNGEFHPSTEGDLPAGKAYLNIAVTSNAPIMSFGDATAIDDVRSKTEDVRGEFYNLNGQRVALPTKGLYILNGKKVIMK